MKKLVLILFCTFSLVVAAQMSPQSSKITAKYFSDPQIEINTPAFLKKKGFTTYDELMTFIKLLQSKHADVMSISYLGTSQKGKQVPCIHLLKTNGNANKIKVWFQGCLHGDEPASTEGLLFLLDRLLNDSSYSYLLDRLDI
ncbi:MAG: M14 family zinc carboxypeptidase [Bacteroidia bacterium]|nr:M14 family zinc carboxypeptidase [Bacteroidia bacterium]